MRKFFLPVLIYFIYKSLWFTWRVRIQVNKDFEKAIQSRSPFILAHWHGDEIALLQLFSKFKIATIVSTSKDGEMMNTLIHLMGGKTSRGSSTRGGVGALKGLVKLVRSGWNCSFAVDGPKGPIYQVKPGVFEISKILHLPIYVIGTASSKRVDFPKSWNKTYLPKFFSKIHIYIDGPYSSVSENSDPRSPVLAEELANRLNAAKQQALKAIDEVCAEC